MFVSPPNSYVDALTPNVMVFGGGGLWEIIDLDEVIRVEPSLMKKKADLCHPTHALGTGCVSTVRRWPSPSWAESLHEEPNLPAPWS